MSDPVKDLIDDLHDQLSTLTGDPNRAKAPYYRFGQKWFDTQEASPVQVRWRKTTFEMGRAEIAGGQPTVNDSTAVSGSIATLNQSLECSIWGKDGAAVYNEFNLICQAIKRFKNPSINSQGVTQPDVNAIGLGNFINYSDRVDRGERCLFDYFVKINVPEVSTDIVAIVTASVQVTASNYIVSASNPVPSGSVEGVRYIEFLSGSQYL